MNKPSFCSILGTMALGIAGLALGGSAWADPPARVARLAYTTGAVSFSPGGESDWVHAVVNRPLTTGDRLWVDTGSRAELQLGSAVIHIDANTSATVLNLDDRVAQLQLAQGGLNLWVRSLAADQTLEVDTPNLAYAIRRPGHYRIQVDADGTATTVMVRQGQAELFGERSAFVLEQGQADRFYGTDLQDYDSIALPPADDFDRWSSDRDRRREASLSARYVSPDLIGYEDLDANGTWRVVEGYGNVWTPNRVAADWAPYHDGHWAWVDPWGWTWVDDAEWGFAPSHYGRWASIDGAWGWIPGPVAVRPVYAPALVAFVGGGNLRVGVSAGGVGAVGWFALGPHDVYRPSYPVSRGYFNNVNTSNTVINTTNITNVYNNVNVTNVVYANQQVRGAVIAVPSASFAQSKPVAGAAVRMSREQLAGTAVVSAAPVAPARSSVLGGAAAPGAKPPAATLARSVVVKAAPPPVVVPFAAMQKALEAHPGQPLDAAAVAALRPGRPPAMPLVKAAASVQPVALPPHAERARGAGPGPSLAAREPAEAPPPRPAPPVAAAAAAVPAHAAVKPPEAAKPPPPPTSSSPPSPPPLAKEAPPAREAPARQAAAPVHAPVPVAAPVPRPPAAPEPQEAHRPHPAAEPGKPAEAHEPPADAQAQARKKEEQRKRAEEEGAHKP